MQTNVPEAMHELLGHHKQSSGWIGWIWCATIHEMITLSTQRHLKPRHIVLLGQEQKLYWPLLLQRWVNLLDLMGCHSQRDANLITTVQSLVFKSPGLADLTTRSATSSRLPKTFLSLHPGEVYKLQHSLHIIYSATSWHLPAASHAVELTKLYSHHSRSKPAGRGV